MNPLRILCCLCALAVARAEAGPFAHAAGQADSTAIYYTDPGFLGWATGFENFLRGPVDISDSLSPLASFGTGASAMGIANARLSNGAVSQASASVVSLGDGGSITLVFSDPITDGTGPDFAVFENSFNDTFLELAFVEVSSDGVFFTRFPTISYTQTTTQIDQMNPPFDAIDPSDIDGFAGKYRVGYGTPFDLAVLAGRPNLDIYRITHVRIRDVIGSLDSRFAQYDDDFMGPHIVNDPWTTPFPSSGFDLDAVGVRHFAVPEPAVGVLFAAGLVGWLGGRRRMRL